MKEFFGKYRGKVVSNHDPKSLGRIQVKVPAVLGDNDNCWAMPAVPYAGANVGLIFLPSADTNIWVEFEGGDINYPIWTGCFWSEGEYPAEANKPEIKLLKLNGILLQLDETSGDGAIKIKIDAPTVAQTIELNLMNDGLMMQMGATSIKLTGTEIKITGSPKSVISLDSVKVDINQGALEVM